MPPSGRRRRDDGFSTFGFRKAGASRRRRRQPGAGRVEAPEREKEAVEDSQGGKVTTVSPGASEEAIFMEDDRGVVEEPRKKRDEDSDALKVSESQYSGVEGDIFTFSHEKTRGGGGRGGGGRTRDRKAGSVDVEAAAEAGATMDDGEVPVHGDDDELVFTADDDDAEGEGGPRSREDTTDDDGGEGVYLPPDEEELTTEELLSRLEVVEEVSWDAPADGLDEDGATQEAEPEAVGGLYEGEEGEGISGEEKGEGSEGAEGIGEGMAGEGEDVAEAGEAVSTDEGAVEVDWDEEDEEEWEGVPAMADEVELEQVPPPEHEPEVVTVDEEGDLEASPGAEDVKEAWEEVEDVSLRDEGGVIEAVDDEGVSGGEQGTWEDEPGMAGDDSDAAPGDVRGEAGMMDGMEMEGEMDEEGEMGVEGEVEMEDLDMGGDVVEDIDEVEVHGEEDVGVDDTAANVNGDGPGEDIEAVGQDPDEDVVLAEGGSSGDLEDEGVPSGIESVDDQDVDDEDGYDEIWTDGSDEEAEVGPPVDEGVREVGVAAVAVEETPADEGRLAGPRRTERRIEAKRERAVEGVRKRAKKESMEDRPARKGKKARREVVGKEERRPPRREPSKTEREARRKRKREAREDGGPPEGRRKREKEARGDGTRRRAPETRTREAREEGGPRKRSPAEREKMMRRKAERERARGAGPSKRPGKRRPEKETDRRKGREDRAERSARRPPRESGPGQRERRDRVGASRERPPGPRRPSDGRAPERSRGDRSKDMRRSGVKGSKKRLPGEGGQRVTGGGAKGAEAGGERKGRVGKNTRAEVTGDDRGRREGGGFQTLFKKKKKGI